MVILRDELVIVRPTASSSRNRYGGSQEGPRLRDNVFGWIGPRATRELGLTPGTDASPFVSELIAVLPATVTIDSTCRIERPRTEETFTIIGEPTRVEAISTGAAQIEIRVEKLSAGLLPPRETAPAP